MGYFEVSKMNFGTKQNNLGIINAKIKIKSIARATLALLSGALGIR